MEALQAIYMNKAAYNERLKLLANLANSFAAAFVSVGLIGPLFAFFYGLVAVNISLMEMFAGTAICLFMSTGLHLLGRAILGGIQE